MSPTWATIPPRTVGSITTFSSTFLAVADIESAKVQAMADLRGEVAQLAIGAAETVVGRNLDEATQVQLVEDYINQVAAQRS